MNPRTTGVLLLVAAALGAFIYFYEIRGADQRASEASEAKRLYPDVVADDIAWIELTTSDGEAVRVERRDDSWRLSKPLDATADEITLDGMASTLAQLTSEAEIPNPQPMEVYGLANPNEVVRFGMGEATYGLRVGIDTPIGANAYASPVGDDAVFVISRWRANSVRKDLASLRDDRIVHFDRNSVRELAVRWPGRLISIERRDGEWWLTDPVQVRADRETVDDLLSDLSFLRANGFVDEPMPDVESGLAPPAFGVQLTIVPEVGQRSQLEFSLGSVEDAGMRIARGMEGALYRVPSERLDDYPRELFDYRFKDLSRFDPDLARRVNITFTDSSSGESVAIEIAKDDDVWTSSEAELAPDELPRLIAELAHLEATSVAAEDLGFDELAALGLNPPRARYRVYVEGIAVEGDAEADTDVGLASEVDLGVADPERGIYARVTGSATVYRIEFGLSEQVPLTLRDFRTRFAASAADPG